MSQNYYVFMIIEIGNNSQSRQTEEFKSGVQESLFQKAILFKVEICCCYLFNFLPVVVLFYSEVVWWD